MIFTAEVNLFFLNKNHDGSCLYLSLFEPGLLRKSEIDIFRLLFTGIFWCFYLFLLSFYCLYIPRNALFTLRAFIDYHDHRKHGYVVRNRYFQFLFTRIFGCFYLFLLSFFLFIYSSKRFIRFNTFHRFWWLLKAWLPKIKPKLS